MHMRSLWLIYMYKRFVKKTVFNNKDSMFENLYKIGCKVIQMFYNLKI